MATKMFFISWRYLDFEIATFTLFTYATGSQRRGRKESWGGGISSASLFFFQGCRKSIFKTANWELKSENNQEWWMCPLKHSFGRYPCAPTNGRFHWSSSRNANLLNASQLRTSAPAFPFVYSCLCLAAITLYRGRGEVTPAHSSIL